MRPRVTVPAWCLLFALQVLPLFSYRWVEDESWYSSTAYTLLHEGKIRNGTFGPDDIESQADTRPIAMPATLATAFRAFGVGPVQARLPEFLASLATIPLAFWLGNLLFSEAAGLVAAAITSVDNFLFLAARSVRPEGFVTFFGALAVVLYVLSRRRDSILLAVLSGVALGISLNYHVIAYGIAASLGLLLIHEFKFAVWRSPRAWALVLASVATLIPFVVWLRADPVRLQAFQALYGRTAKEPFGQLVNLERIRYADFLGIGNRRLSFVPFPIPLRLHVLLLTVAALTVLAWKRRALFWTLFLLIVPSLFIWPKTGNPTARYFAVLAPFFGVAAGAALASIKRPRWHSVFLACCAVVIVTEFAGNLLVLRESRRANYAAVSSSLRQLVPRDARVYGAITFFLALYDRPYYSWPRTPFDFAVQKLGVNYMILNDRVLVHGSGQGLDEWRDIRETANRFAETRADLVGTIPDPFYGDLKVYRVRQ